MSELTLHRSVALAALVALLAVSSVPAGATTHASLSDSDRSPASLAPSTTTDGNESTAVDVAFDPRAAPDQRIAIRTNADPGTTLTVELRENGNFLDVLDATVSANGNATPTVDLSSVEPGAEVTVAVRRGERTLAETSATVAASSTVVREGDRLVLHAAQNQTVRVRTDAPSGSELVVDLRAGGTFLKTASAVVDGDGTATATFDLRDADPGTEFRVRVRSPDFAATEDVEGILVGGNATVHRDGRLTVSAPSSEFRIRGRSDLPPGTELDVRLNATGSSFAASRSVVVGEDGGFDATVDLSSLSAGAELSVDVVGLPRPVSALATTDGRSGVTVYALPDVPVRATLRHAGDELLVRAAADQTIRGTTNVQPGTELVVTVENTEMNIPNPVKLSETVTVRGDGNFAATFDFSGADPGTALAVEVDRSGGPPLVLADARVVNESAAIPTTGSGARGESTGTATTATATGNGDVGTPGFGVPAAVGALLAALALARRA